MQGKKLLAAMVGLAAAFITTQSLAMMSVPIGWYLEANVGSTHLSNESWPGKTSSSGIGGNLDLGYKFMPYFATEIGYTQYANTTVKNSNTSQKAGSIKYYSYGIWGKGILPIVDSGAELFAKLGVARLTATVTIDNTQVANNIGLGSGGHSSTNVYMAIGGQYYFMPEFAVNIQWSRVRGSNTTGTMDLISIGASFIFE